MSLTRRQQIALSNAEPSARISLRAQFRSQNAERNNRINNNFRRNRGNARRNFPRQFPGSQRNLVGVYRQSPSLLNQSVPSTLLSNEASVVTFTHVTQTVGSPAHDRANTQFFAMRPYRQGLSHMTYLFEQFRYQLLQIRFVGIMPSTTNHTVYHAYTTTQHEIQWNPSQLSGHTGFNFCNASGSTPWTTVVSPSNTIAMYKLNDRRAAQQNGENSHGWLHFMVNPKRANGEGADTAVPVGHFEIRGRVEFFGHKSEEH